jgi:hypothetical protein
MTHGRQEHKGGKEMSPIVERSEAEMEIIREDLGDLALAHLEALRETE